MNAICVNQILETLRERFPDFQENFHKIEKSSSEIILFGSYAHGCERQSSDVDIIFIGDKNSPEIPKDTISKDFDFLWIDSRKTTSKSWLSSELAIHIAHYGLWLKGDGVWRENTFFGSAAIMRKKRIIYNKLTSLYLQKDKPRANKKYGIIAKLLVNVLRLRNLTLNTPNPPTRYTLEETSSLKYILDEIFEPKLLGQLGRLYFEEILRKQARDYQYSADDHSMFLGSPVNHDTVETALCDIYDSMRRNYLR